MSTRACYVFADELTGEAPHIVYKHHDGYPSGAAKWLDAALRYAWPLPRYEADEFAAAFVAANKSRGGDVRLVGAGDWRELAAPDCQYLYIVKPLNGVPTVYGYRVRCDWKTQVWAEPEELFVQPLASIASLGA